MKQFRKLMIENFQSHERTEVDLASGLNVFVGASDSGKSAILRALRWVLFNVPRGVDYIRTGSTRCQVTLQLNDGTQIQRVRSTGSINRYILRRPEEEELVFEGFGSDVPQEILDAHQMKPLKLDQKEEILLQFGSQLEGPFLLSESAGTKAKTLGLISGAHIMDLALKQANSDRSLLSTDIRYAEQTQTSLKEKLTPYQDLSQLREQLEQTKNRYQQLKDLQNRLERLRKSAHLYHVMNEEKQEYQRILEQLIHLPKIEQRKGQIELMEFKRRQLHLLSVKWHNNQQEQMNLRQQLDQLRHLPSAEAISNQLTQQWEAHRRLKRMESLWNHYQLQKEEVTYIMNACKGIQQAEMKQELYLQQNKQKRQLKQIYTNFQTIKDQKRKVYQFLENTKSVPRIQESLIPHIEHVGTILEKYRHLANLYMEIKKSLSVGAEYHAQIERTIQKLTKQYADLLRVLGKCPTCGSVIHGDLLEHLMNEFGGGTLYAAAGRENEKN